MVNAKFRKTGKTQVVLESPTGDKTTFEIDIKSHRYEINKK